MRRRCDSFGNGGGNSAAGLRIEDVNFPRVDPQFGDVTWADSRRGVQACGDPALRGELQLLLHDRPRCIIDDVAAGRLIVPFAGPALPARAYHAYLPDARLQDPSVKAFCDWLEEVGGLEAAREASTGSRQ